MSAEKAAVRSQPVPTRGSHTSMRQRLLRSSVDGFWQSSLGRIKAHFGACHSVFSPLSPVSSLPAAQQDSDVNGKSCAALLDCWPARKKTLIESFNFNSGQQRFSLFVPQRQRAWTHITLVDVSEAWCCSVFTSTAPGCIGCILISCYSLERP